MTDKQFIEEVRARTGEPVYEDMIMIMDKEYCASSLSLAKALFKCD